MNELDKQYNLTNDQYGMGDFIEDLKRKGYLADDENNPGGLRYLQRPNKASGNLRWKKFLES